MRSSAANPPRPRRLEAGLTYVPQHRRHIRQLLQNPGAEVADFVHDGFAGGRRLLAYIVIPGLNGAALSEYFKTHSQGAAGLLGMYNMFAGGAYGNCAVGALGIMPYITATIIIQLLQAVVPRLSKLAREEGGRSKIIQYGRYLTVLVCIGQGLYFAGGWENPEKFFPGLQEPLVLVGNHACISFKPS